MTFYVSSINREGTAHVSRLPSGAQLGIHLRFLGIGHVPEAHAHAGSKLDAERLVSKRHGEFTIVRPTLVYRREGGQELQMFLRYLRPVPDRSRSSVRGWRARPGFGRKNRRWARTPGWHEIAFGKIYNFSGGEAITCAISPASCCAITPQSAVFASTGSRCAQGCRRGAGRADGPAALDLERDRRCGPMMPTWIRAKRCATLAIRPMVCTKGSSVAFHEHEAHADNKNIIILSSALLLHGCSTLLASRPEALKMARCCGACRDEGARQKATHIVWSSSRAGNHDLFR